MGSLLRVFFAPAIISAYTTYGTVSAARSNVTGSVMRRARNCVAGAMAGFTYGSYYVITGRALTVRTSGELLD